MKDRPLVKGRWDCGQKTELCGKPKKSGYSDIGCNCTGFRNGGCLMEIKRDVYLDKLIRKKKNGLIKIVTGVRRCGKSYLLFHLFHAHLYTRVHRMKHGMTISFMAVCHSS